MTIEQCPVKWTTDIIGGKWKPLIIYYLKLGGGAMRYGELQRHLKGISKKVLTQQIRELERDDIVERKVYDGRALRVEYAITEHGRTLAPVLEAMSSWGKAHRQKYGNANQRR